MKLNGKGFPHPYLSLTVIPAKAGIQRLFIRQTNAKDTGFQLSLE
jgi:hypothetical protein